VKGRCFAVSAPASPLKYTHNPHNCTPLRPSSIACLPDLVDPSLHLHLRPPFAQPKVLREQTALKTCVREQFHAKVASAVRFSMFPEHKDHWKAFYGVQLTPDKFLYMMCYGTGSIRTLPARGPLHAYAWSSGASVDTLLSSHTGRSSLQRPPSSM
jgi:hypothetical protein